MTYLRLAAVGLTFALAGLMFPACKAHEDPHDPPQAPPDERLNGMWFSSALPGATLTINLAEQEAQWMQQLLGSFNPTTSPNELSILGGSYVGITEGLNDNGNLTPGETYANTNFLAETFPASTFEVAASNRYVLWQHLSAQNSVGVRYTSAFPSFFFLPMPFLLTQTDNGRVHGNAELLHFDFTLGRYIVEYSLDEAGTRPALELFGFTLLGEPGGTDLVSGSPWQLDDRGGTGMLLELTANGDGFLSIRIEAYVAVSPFLPAFGPLWGTALTYRFVEHANEQQLELIEYEPFQNYEVRDNVDGIFSLQLALWTLAEGHSSWTVPTTMLGQTGMIFIESLNPLTGLAAFAGVPLYVPLGAVNGVVGAWINPDTDNVVTFAADGRWASGSGATGHWRSEGERVYYAEERLYQR